MALVNLKSSFFCFFIVKSIRVTGKEVANLYIHLSTKWWKCHFSACDFWPCSTTISAYRSHYVYMDYIYMKISMLDFWRSKIEVTSFIVLCAKTNNIYISHCKKLLMKWFEAVTVLVQTQCNSAFFAFNRRQSVCFGTVFSNPWKLASDQLDQTVLPDVEDSLLDQDAFLRVSWRATNLWFPDGTVVA